MASIQGHVSNLFVSHNESFALVLPDGNGLKASVTDVPRKSPDPSIKNTKKICVTAGAVSAEGQYVAVCDDSKTLSVWKREGPGLNLIGTHSLATRSDHVTFTSDPTCTEVIVSDKSGDVIRFPLTPDAKDLRHQDENQSSNGDGQGEGGGGGEVVLGHLSMLLGTEISPCGKYILTADRDEKLRVSHWPNAYNIHGYCLGHTEFVSGLRILGTRVPNVAVTASGDGSLRTWNYSECRQIAVTHVGVDAGVSVVSGGGASLGGGDGGKLKRADVPGVRSIKVHQDAGRIAVHLEFFDNGLVIYNCTAEGRLEFERKVHVPSPVVDYNFTNDGNLLVLVAAPSGNLVFVDPSNGSSKPCGDAFLVDFFNGLDVESNGPTPLDNYYKRWFDNVQAYQENKEKRINETKISDSSEVVDSKRICTEKS